MISRGKPGERNEPYHPLGPVDRGAWISLVALGLITALFLAQLAYGVVKRENGRKVVEKRRKGKEPKLREGTKAEEWRGLAAPVGKAA